MTDAPVEPILAFLTEFQNDPISMLTDPCRFGATSRPGMGELVEWDILFASTRDRIISRWSTDRSGSKSRVSAGSEGKSRRASTLLISDNQRVASRGVEKTGVDPEAAKAAEASYRLAENLAMSRSRIIPTASTALYGRDRS